MKLSIFFSLRLPAWHLAMIEASHGLGHGRSMTLTGTLGRLLEVAYRSEHGDAAVEAAKLTDPDYAAMVRARSDVRDVTPAQEQEAMDDASSPT